MAHMLEAHGFRALAVDLVPSDGAVGLDELAGQVGSFVERELAPGEPFDLVGFSMGGLVSRYYVQRLGGVERVGRLITISAPHRGTCWAYTGGNKGWRQMRPGSEFLVELNRNASILERVKFVSIWTPLDLTIVPAWSSRLGVGEEFQVPVMLHPWMLGDRRCVELVGRLLRA